MIKEKELIDFWMKHKDTNLVKDDYSNNKKYAVVFESIYSSEILSIADKFLARKGFFFLYNVVKNLVDLYEPVLNKDLVEKGLVEVTVLGKSLNSLNKRTHMKIGKFITKVAPFMPDTDKEKSVKCLCDMYTSYEGCEVVFADSGFEELVTMRIGKRIPFTPCDYYKNIADSCMRHSAEYFDISNHPYETYESGDFYFVYFIKDDLMTARTLVHKESKTYSAIYGSTLGSCEYLENHLKSKGYNVVDEEGKAWEGAKLKLIEEDVYSFCEDRFKGVYVVPYIDFWDWEYGSVVDGYIVLSTEYIPNAYRVLLKTADGWYEC